MMHQCLHQVFDSFMRFCFSPLVLSLLKITPKIYRQLTDFDLHPHVSIPLGKPWHLWPRGAHSACS